MGERGAVVGVRKEGVAGGSKRCCQVSVGCRCGCCVGEGVSGRCAVEGGGGEGTLEWMPPRPSVPSGEGEY